MIERWVLIGVMRLRGGDEFSLEIDGRMVYRGASIAREICDSCIRIYII